MSKRVFLESPFLLCSLKVFRTKHLKGPENLKGAEKKRTLQKNPFGQPFLRTTPSPLLWRTLIHMLISGPTQSQGQSQSQSRDSGQPNLRKRHRSESRGSKKLSEFSNSSLQGYESGPHPQYGWDFPEEIPEKIRKDPGNALRAFPGIPLESTAGMPQIQKFKAFEASRAFPEIISPPVRLGTPLFSELVPERASQSCPWNSQQYWGHF